MSFFFPKLFQVYIFDFDHSSTPVKYPKRVLPSAVLTLDRKPCITLQSPFLAVDSGVSELHWEVKGETRRGFRWTVTKTKASRLTLKHKVDQVRRRRSLSKEVNQKNLPQSNEDYPPVLNRFDTELTTKENPSKDQPPVLDKADKLDHIVKEIDKKKQRLYEIKQRFARSDSPNPVKEFDTHLCELKDADEQSSGTNSTMQYLQYKRHNTNCSVLQNSISDDSNSEYGVKKLLAHSINDTNANLSDSLQTEFWRNGSTFLKSTKVKHSYMPTGRTKLIGEFSNNKTSRILPHSLKNPVVNLIRIDSADITGDNKTMKSLMNSDKENGISFIDKNLDYASETAGRQTLTIDEEESQINMKELNPQNDTKPTTKPCVSQTEDKPSEGDCNNLCTGENKNATNINANFRCATIFQANFSDNDVQKLGSCRSQEHGIDNADCFDSTFSPLQAQDLVVSLYKTQSPELLSASVDKSEPRKRRISYSQTRNNHKSRHDINKKPKLISPCQNKDTSQSYLKEWGLEGKTSERNKSKTTLKTKNCSDIKCDRNKPIKKQDLQLQGKNSDRSKFACHYKHQTHSYADKHTKENHSSNIKSENSKQLHKKTSENFKPDESIYAIEKSPLSHTDSLNNETILKLRRVKSSNRPSESKASESSSQKTGSQKYLPISTGSRVIELDAGTAFDITVMTRRKSKSDGENHFNDKYLDFGEYYFKRSRPSAEACSSKPNNVFIQDANNNNSFFKHSSFETPTKEAEYSRKLSAEHENDTEPTSAELTPKMKDNKREHEYMRNLHLQRTSNIGVCDKSTNERWIADISENLNVGSVVETKDNDTVKENDIETSMYLRSQHQNDLKLLLSTIVRNSDQVSSEHMRSVTADIENEQRNGPFGNSKTGLLRSRKESSDAQPTVPQTELVASASVPVPKRVTSAAFHENISTCLSKACIASPPVANTAPCLLNKLPKMASASNTDPLQALTVSVKSAVTSTDTCVKENYDTPAFHSRSAIHSMADNTFKVMNVCPLSTMANENITTNAVSSGNENRSAYNKQTLNTRPVSDPDNCLPKFETILTQGTRLLRTNETSLQQVNERQNEMKPNSEFNGNTCFVNTLEVGKLATVQQTPSDTISFDMHQNFDSAIAKNTHGNRQDEFRCNNRIDGSKEASEIEPFCSNMVCTSISTTNKQRISTHLGSSKKQDMLVISPEKKSVKRYTRVDSETARKLQQFLQKSIEFAQKRKRLQINKDNRQTSTIECKNAAIKELLPRTFFDFNEPFIRDEQLSRNSWVSLSPTAEQRQNSSSTQSLESMYYLQARNERPTLQRSDSQETVIGGVIDCQFTSADEQVANLSDDYKRKRESIVQSEAVPVLTNPNRNELIETEDAMKNQITTGSDDCNFIHVQKGRDVMVQTGNCENAIDTLGALGETQCTVNNDITLELTSKSTNDGHSVHPVCNALKEIKKGSSEIPINTCTDFNPISLPPPEETRSEITKTLQQLSLVLAEISKLSESKDVPSTNITHLNANTARTKPCSREYEIERMKYSHKQTSRQMTSKKLAETFTGNMHTNVYKTHERDLQHNEHSGSALSHTQGDKSEIMHAEKHRNCFTDAEIKTECTMTASKDKNCINQTDENCSRNETSASLQSKIKLDKLMPGNHVNASFLNKSDKTLSNKTSPAALAENSGIGCSGPVGKIKVEPTDNDLDPPHTRERNELQNVTITANKVNTDKKETSESLIETNSKTFNSFDHSKCEDIQKSSTGNNQSSSLVLNEVTTLDVQGRIPLCYVKPEPLDIEFDKVENVNSENVTDNRISASLTPSDCRSTFLKSDDKSSCNNKITRNVIGASQVSSTDDNSSLSHKFESDNTETNTMDRTSMELDSGITLLTKDIKPSEKHDVCEREAAQINDSEDTYMPSILSQTRHSNTDDKESEISAQKIKSPLQTRVCTENSQFESYKAREDEDCKINSGLVSEGVLITKANVSNHSLDAESSKGRISVEEITLADSREGVKDNFSKDLELPFVFDWHDAPNVSLLETFGNPIQQIKKRDVLNFSVDCDTDEDERTDITLLDIFQAKQRTDEQDTLINNAGPATRYNRAYINPKPQGISTNPKPELLSQDRKSLSNVRKSNHDMEITHSVCNNISNEFYESNKDLTSNSDNVFAAKEATSCNATGNIVINIDILPKKESMNTSLCTLSQNNLQTNSCTADMPSKQIQDLAKSKCSSASKEKEQKVPCISSDELPATRPFSESKHGNKRLSPEAKHAKLRKNQRLQGTPNFKIDTKMFLRKQFVSRAHVCRANRFDKNRINSRKSFVRTPRHCLDSKHKSMQMAQTYENTSEAYDETEDTQSLIKTDKIQNVSFTADFIGNNGRLKTHTMTEARTKDSSCVKHDANIDGDSSSDGFNEFDAFKYKKETPECTMTPYNTPFQCFGKGRPYYFQYRRKFPYKGKRNLRETPNSRKSKLVKKRVMTETERLTEREIAKREIEDAVKHFRRTYEGTWEDLLGDGKVATYLETITKKLEVIQSKRSKAYEESKEEYDKMKTTSQLKRSKSERQIYSSHGHVKQLQNLDEPNDNTASNSNLLADSHNVLHDIVKEQFIKQVNSMTAQVRHELTERIIEGIVHSSKTKSTDNVSFNKDSCLRFYDNVQPCDNNDNTLITTEENICQRPSRNNLQAVPRWRRRYQPYWSKHNLGNTYSHHKQRSSQLFSDSSSKFDRNVASNQTSFPGRFVNRIDRIQERTNGFLPINSTEAVLGLQNQNVSFLKRGCAHSSNFGKKRKNYSYQNISYQSRFRRDGQRQRSTRLDYKEHIKAGGSEFECNYSQDMLRFIESNLGRPLTDILSRSGNYEEDNLNTYARYEYDRQKTRDSHEKSNQKGQNTCKQINQRRHGSYERDNQGGQTNCDDNSHRKINNNVYKDSSDNKRVNRIICNTDMYIMPNSNTACKNHSRAYDANSCRNDNVLSAKHNKYCKGHSHSNYGYSKGRSGDGNLNSSYNVSNDKHSDPCKGRPCSSNTRSSPRNGRCDSNRPVPSKDCNKCRWSPSKHDERTSRSRSSDSDRRSRKSKSEDGEDCSKRSSSRSSHDCHSRSHSSRGDDRHSPHLDASDIKHPDGWGNYMFENDSVFPADELDHGCKMLQSDKQFDKQMESRETSDSDDYFMTNKKTCTNKYNNDYAASNEFFHSRNCFKQGNFDFQSNCRFNNRGAYNRQHEYTRSRIRQRPHSNTTAFQRRS